MKIDLSYLPEEDRLSLSLQGQVGWLFTRSLLIKLINAWIDKLQKVELPDVGFSLGDRDIGLEHCPLSLMDPPQLRKNLKQWSTTDFFKK